MRNGRLFGVGRLRSRCERVGKGPVRPRRTTLEQLEDRQLLATYTVINTADDGAGSLRQAIIDSNTNAGTDLIDFAIGGTGTQTINLLSALPAITDTVTIDATSQDPQSDQPLIVLNGANAGTADGFRISANNVTIRRLGITNFSGNGILVEADSAAIAGVRIGGAGAGNGLAGIVINNASGVLIGTSAANERTVVSGNAGAGISILGSSSSGNRIINTFVGLDATGAGALPNGTGILVSGGASNNQIGSAVPGEETIVSGNTGAGIVIEGSGSNGNRIFGTRVGTNREGTASIGNGGPGISIDQGAETVIGGLLAGEGNIIGANGGAGILIANADRTSILGNRIGTNQTLIADLGNTGAGIHIVNGNETTIGNRTTGAGNTIAFNAKGIAIVSGIQNPILGNAIFDNDDLGIDLGDDGVTPNDSADPDTGANNLQNFPILTSATTGAGQTLIQGSLNSAPNTSYFIEFFVNDERDPSGFGEGQQSIGTLSVTTNASGVATISASLAIAAGVGQFLTATASTVPTDIGNTSEFSQAIAVAQAQVADLVVSITDSPDPVITGENLTYVVTIFNQGLDPATAVQYSQSLPLSLTVVSITPSQGTLTESGGIITGTLGTIAAGASATVTVVVTPNQVGPVTTSVTVTSSEIDPNPLNNSASATTRVANPADLNITGSPDANPVVVGQEIAFNLVVANFGEDPATNVIVTSTVPAGVNLVNVFTGQGTVEIVGNQITARLGTLAVGAATAVRVILLPSSTGTVTQTFTVTSDGLETNPADNSVTLSVNVTPAANTGVTLQAPTEVATGQEFNFVATVSNDGPAPATGVSLQSVLPDGLVPVSATVSNGGSTSIAGKTVTATIGNLSVGGQVTVTIRAVADGAFSGVTTTTVTLSQNEGDLFPENNSASAAVAVNTVDLVLTQTIDPDPPVLNVPLTYHLLITNNGINPATGVVLTNTLSGSVTFQEALSSIGGPGGTFSLNAGVLTVTLAGPIAPGAQVPVNIVVIPTVTAIIENTAVVVSDQFDTNPDDNTLTSSDPISPADLSAALTGPAGSIFVGETTNLTLIVTNGGPSPATGVVATLPIPTSLEFVSATGNSTFANGVLTTNVGSLAPGAQQIIVVTVRATSAATQALTASVTGNELDGVLDNNQSTLTLTAINAPGIIQFSTATYSQFEDAGVAVITLTRTSGTEGNVSVFFQTSSGSAVAGVNYVSVSGTAVFLDGQTTTSFSIELIPDGQITGTLTVGLVISDPTGNASLGSQSTATLQILDIDVDTVAPTVTGITLSGTGTRTSSILVQFSEPMDPTRAGNPSNYQLRGPRGQSLPLQGVFYNASLNQATVTPSNTLAGGAIYQIIINGTAPNGLTDIWGNLLSGDGSGQAGINFVSNFGRASKWTYIDSDGDRVNLQIRNGGVIDLFRAANGDAQLVRISRYSRRSILTGSVRPTAQGGNGRTNLGRIEGVSFGQLDSRLKSPPFFVDSLLQNSPPPFVVLSVPRVSAKSAFPRRFR